MADSPVSLAVPARAAAGVRDAPGAWTLGNERYRTLITDRGTGVSQFEGFALNRWAPDPLGDEGGWYVYLDEPGLAPWSIGVLPVAPRAGRAAAVGTRGSFTLIREEFDLEARLTVAVVPLRGLELRRVTVINRSGRPRAIGLTSAFEIVLHDRAADRSHPAFSRLFVQTDWDAARGALLASRRLRGADERFPLLAHAILEERGPDYDSDRARFLGRTSGRDRPRALLEGGPLSRTVGNALDPVAALRATRRLAPGEVLELTFLLAAGWSRAEVIAAVEKARLDGPDRLIAEALALSEDVVGAGSSDDPIWFLEPEADAAPAIASAPARIEPEDDAETLAFWNGFGGFAPGGREYVVRMPIDADGRPLRPPLPWVNVIANENFGCVVSESGAGATWSQNSRERRLTPWSNDPLLDPHGEALYVRDEDTGVVISPLPGPAPGGGSYEMRHGFGVSRCLHASGGLSFETSLFVPRHDPLKITRVRVTNTLERPRRLSLVAYQRLVLGAVPEETAASIVTSRDPRTGALFATRPDDALFPARVAFATLAGGQGARLDGPAAFAYTCDRASFLGPRGDLARPRALRDATAFDGRAGVALEPCFAQRVVFELAPGASVTWDALLGDAADQDEARALVARFRAPGACALALEESRRFWDELLSAVRVKTPAPALDAVLNGWMTYQTLSCRMWGRTAFYQSGGAFGFRDQLQDASALLHYRPALCRAQILLHAAHQFTEGDVLHWWHPPGDHGLRTRFADDLLWLPLLTATYVQATGDLGVLDERAPYLTARLLEPGEQEILIEPKVSDASGDLYEHGCRAIDRSLTVGVGAHGLPLFGCGDWNDGMNRVGQGGRGESVWMGFFLCTVLDAFVPLCERRGDRERAQRYAEARARLAAAIEREGWDGEWYRRGYYDDGTPLGSKVSDECRIDALAQAWAVLSGVAPHERARSALDAVERELVDHAAGIVRLLAPPFEHTPRDPGYIKGYVPGVRENGGQYTHAALWFVRALAESGRRDRAAHLLEALSPVSHAQDVAQTLQYQIEPYVITADVYGAEPHVGRGGWSWYTGSSGWMIRVALESILGLTEVEGRAFVLKPAIPDDWPGFRIERRLPEGTVYEFEVVHPGGPAEVVVRVTLDARDLAPEGDAAVVPIERDGRRHRVAVELGARAGTATAPGAAR